MPEPTPRPRARMPLAALTLLLLALPLRAAEPAAAEKPAAAPQPALRVYLVRHARAWKNVSPWLRPSGMKDDDLDALTEKGYAEAERVGHALDNAHLAAVYSSPARRARQTAETLAKAAGLATPPIVSEAFRPLDPGDRGADYGWRTGNWKRGQDPRPAGGESLADGLARAAAAIDAAAAAHPGRAIAIVSHGEIVSALRSRAAGIDPVASYQRSFVGEASVSEIRVDADGGWHLVKDAATPH